MHSFIEKLLYPGKVRVDFDQQVILNQRALNILKETEKERPWKSLDDHLKDFEQSTTVWMTSDKCKIDTSKNAVIDAYEFKRDNDGYINLFTKTLYSITTFKMDIGELSEKIEPADYDLYLRSIRKANLKKINADLTNGKYNEEETILLREGLEMMQQNMVGPDQAPAYFLTGFSRGIVLSPALSDD